jgi:hypothetical protein
LKEKYGYTGTDDQRGKPDGWLPASTTQKPQVKYEFKNFFAIHDTQN